MVPKAPSTHAIRALQSYIEPSKLYTCEACRYRFSRYHATTSGRPANTGSFPIQYKVGPRQSTQLRQVLSRSARSVTYSVPVVSTTSTRAAPERNKELHTALNELENQAAEYVNLSMLALALRSLESSDPVTRIAICGNDNNDAKRLARVLLISPEFAEEEWEKTLGSYLSDQKALLIRYGAAIDIDQANPLVNVVSMPAKSLQELKLEILLLQRGQSDRSATKHTFPSEEDSLVQTIETPISRTGRFSQVAYPVHKTIILGKGIEGLLNIGNIKSTSNDYQESFRRVAVDLDHDNPGNVPQDYGLSLVNVDQAERAINRAREGTSDAQKYDKDWNGSGINLLRQFIFDGILPAKVLKPFHRQYIKRIIKSAMTRISQEKASIQLSQLDSAETAASLASVQQSITIWSASAHSELRAELANAFAGRSWRKLAWWKLPFRIDDIGMIGSDLLTRFYLSDAEKGSIWVAGRLEQAGLTTALQALKELQERQLENSHRLDRGELIEVETGNDREDPEDYFHAKEPWPQYITESRHRLLTQSLPSLQRKAQSILLEAFSGICLSNAVGALAYVMVSSTGLYEAGAVAAFGTVICLRRMQKQWEKAKDFFVSDAETEGRTAVEKIQREYVHVVRNGVDLHNTPLDGQEARDRAEIAIMEASNALERLR